MPCGIGDVTAADALGHVPEGIFEHKILVPPGVAGSITKLESGSYTTTRGLDTGSYFAITKYSGQLDELFDNIDDYRKYFTNAAGRPGRRSSVSPSTRLRTSSARSGRR